MTWTPHTPRHLDTTRAPDTGASDVSKPWPGNREALYAYQDAWAGNPDTDKHWSKES